MHTYIVTGTTRGLGQAIADLIVHNGDQLLTLSSAADHVRANWNNIECDLRASETVVPCLKRLLSKGIHSSTDHLVLINNAGVLAPIGGLGQIREDHIQDHLVVNQVAPALLMSAFIRLTLHFSGKRRIINISSGAARHPYAGWSLYCASKAALEMMTLCVASEQKGAVDPVSVCAVSPGKVATDMQVMIRHSDPARFPAQPKFVQAKLSGELVHPEVAARQLLSLDRGGQLKDGGIYDLRNAVDHHGELRIEPVLSA